MSKINTGMKICNTEKDSNIEFFSGLREETDIDEETGEKIKFFVPELGSIILTKEIKKKIWLAVNECYANNFFYPFVILVPEKFFSNKNIPVQEVPIPFAEHYILIVPYIREIMVYEQWRDEDNE